MNDSFVRLLEQQLGKEWQRTVTEDAVDFYRQLFYAGIQEGIRRSTETDKTRKFFTEGK